MKAVNNCKSCFQAIIFARTKTGSLLPVNVDTLSNEELEKYKSGEEITFRYGIHISHFATCPDAKLFRREKK
jgi:hypothetical protein